ncbi:hypothetical protein ANN_10575 [Periplaneta americana]|uniref:DUF659 domain-containing protein n=1 Tax=Periplaneta americana TaxID=6978 RepID=A0ABQ8TPL7_PERAM|nr:hypothetical protein ANN_10575 [Periplaneta americana]
MGESRNAYRVLVGRPEGKRPLGMPRRRWEDNIKIDLRKMGYDGRDWINLAQDRDQWRTYVRAAMNLRIATVLKKRNPSVLLTLMFINFIRKFTNVELADMNMAYGADYSNANEAWRVYVEQHPQRHIPCHATSSRLDQRPRDSGQLLFTTFKSIHVAILHMTCNFLLVLSQSALFTCQLPFSIFCFLNDTTSTRPARLFSVDGIGDKKMVFGEMRPRIRHRLSDIRLTVEEDFERNPTRLQFAAQQLNASQSTHRFSFVNHTIKTVNMPKVRHSVNLKSKLTSYISEFKEDGLSTDNKILFCNLCQCAVSSTQKFLVQQHITTSKHQANKQLNSKQRQLFLTQPTTSNEFLEKYTQHTIPDESTLRKTYAPSIYDETIQKIRDEIKDSSIWVSIDETPDKEGRLVGNVVIGLLSEQYSERILLHCDVLEKCNNKTIVKLFNEAMGILWPKGIMYDNVLFFISDAAPYMVKAGQALSVVYPKLTHFTCVAHAFHRVAEVVRDNFLK